MAANERVNDYSDGNFIGSTNGCNRRSTSVSDGEAASDDGSEIILVNTETEGRFSYKICCAKFLRTVKGITVEPVMFMFMMGITLQANLTTNLLLERVCVLDYNNSVFECNNMSTNSSLQTEVQQRVAQLLMYSELVAALPSLWLAPLLGAWSDKHGRKLPLVLPFVGSFIAALITAVWAYLPGVAAEWLVACSIPKGLCGGLAIVAMAAFSHISDNTAHSSRTGRIALVDVGLSGGAASGLMLSSVIYESCGYWPVYIVSGAFYAATGLYIMARIENQKPASVDDGAELRDKRGGAWRGGAVQETLGAVLRPRPLWGRAGLLLLLFALICCIFAFGSVSLLVLFTRRMFAWGYTAFIRFSVYTIVLQAFATLLFLYVLSYRLGVHDCWLALVSAATHAVAVAGTAISTSPTQIYIAGFFSSLGLVPLITSRALLSKSVAPAELGKVFSFLSTGESVVPLIANPAFTQLYRASVATFPGAAFFLASGSYLVAATIFGFLLVLRRRGLIYVTDEPTPPPSPPLLQLASSMDSIHV